MEENIMHWAERLADEIITKSPNKEEYLCAAGISPSGSVHIGNFRDIATCHFVCLALRKRGKRARLLFSWDEFDRFRKVPANVTDENFYTHIGKPYSDVPDPFGCCESYAAHFEQEFERALKTFQIEVDFRYQTAEYRSGRYTEHLITAIEKRGEIYDILDGFRTQGGTDEERGAYYPVSIYCAECGKDNTKIRSYETGTHTARYSCKCGHDADFCFDTDFNCKLNWKIDWPMRWMAEGVDFEPGGKDHASPMGSFSVSRIIADKIYGANVPVFQGYEFVGIKGSTGKMSGSTGLNLTPEALFQVFQPEIILWLYAKTDPMRAFNFCFDEEILRQYFEFDKQYTAARAEDADELLKTTMSYCDIPGRTLVPAGASLKSGTARIAAGGSPVPMPQLASFGSVVDFEPDVLETIFSKIGTPYTREDFAERLVLAKNWLHHCSPESVNRLLESKNTEYFNSLCGEEKAEVAALYDYLNTREYTLDELQTALYAIPKTIRGGVTDEKLLKKIQAVFFKNVYQLLLGADKGPRLYLFLYAVEKSKYMPLLEFQSIDSAG
jgi:lysyl-tRNA synthetase class 1